MNAAAAKDVVAFRATSSLATSIDGVISVFVGLAITASLFSLMCHVKQGVFSQPAPGIEDRRFASLPVEIPPPRETRAET